MKNMMAFAKEFGDNSFDFEGKGYKLPCNVKDLHKFVNHGKSMILPMLARIAKAGKKYWWQPIMRSTF